MIRRTFLALSAGLILTLAGCSGGASVIEVGGTVTLNGKELPEGDIVFVPTDSKLGGEGGKIKDGKYRLKAKPGKNKVEIRATREVPGKTMPSAAGPGAPPEPLRESIIPTKYNDQTTLEADVGPGKSTFNFDLKTP
jgi:hypothetical protein